MNFITIFILLLVIQTPQAKSMPEIKTEAPPSWTEAEAKSLADLQTRSKKVCVDQCARAALDAAESELDSAKGKETILTAAVLLRDTRRTVKADVAEFEVINQEFNAIVTAARNRIKCADCVPDFNLKAWVKPQPAPEPAKK